MDLGHPQLAQMALQLRNASAHIQWSLTNHDPGQVTKAHDHVHRATLDACKVLWEARSAEVARIRSLTGPRVRERYAQLMMTAFQDADRSGDVLDDWLEFLVETGVVDEPSLASELPAAADAPLEASEIARLAELAKGWESLRLADAKLTALTLRMSEALLPSYRDLWFIFCGQALGQPADELATYLPHLAGDAPHLSFEHGLRVALGTLEYSLDAWKSALVEEALGDTAAFDAVQRRRLKDRLRRTRDAGGTAEQAFVDAYDLLETWAPWYPISRREGANSRARIQFESHRPTQGRMLDVAPDGLIWFCDMVGSSDLPPEQMGPSLEGFLTAAASCLLQARDAEVLIAANTWGDQAMAAFIDKQEGMAALAALLTGYLDEAPPGLRFRIGLAAGELRRLRNPIVLYDVTGLPVIEAARLEPCATPEERHEVLCSRATVDAIGDVPGWRQEPVTRTVAKSFSFEGTHVEKGDTINLVKLSPIPRS